jgi:hypothetical protein
LKILGILERGVVARLLGLQSGRGIVERLLWDERALEQLVGPVVRLLRLREIGSRLLDIRRLSEGGRC